mgnify:CR=1 FL=1
MIKSTLLLTIVSVVLLPVSPIYAFAGNVQDYPDFRFDGSGGMRLIAQAEEVDDEFFFPEDLEEEQEIYRISDPLRPFNVAMFHFNDKLYFWILKPVAKGWRAVVPDPARTGMKNFFYNLTMPIRFVNSLLQLKGQKAAAELGRFAFNTSLGVLGFANPAKDFENLNPEPEDLGQTLGRYNIGHGFYLFLPVIGPSSARDAVGKVGDSFLDPVRYVDPWELRSGAQGVDAVNNTSFRIGDYETLKEAAINPYDAIKNAYIQRRLRSVEN